MKIDLLVTLPLWTPSTVHIGDVGYLLKPSGSFFTLFNALQRTKTPGGLTGGFPSMAGYGSVSKGHIRLDKRNVAQKGLDAFTGLLAFRTKHDVPLVFVFFAFPIWMLRVLMFC